MGFVCGVRDESASASDSLSSMKAGGLFFAGVALGAEEEAESVRLDFLLGGAGAGAGGDRAGVDAAGFWAPELSAATWFTSLFKARFCLGFASRSAAGGVGAGAVSDKDSVELEVEFEAESFAAGAFFLFVLPAGRPRLPATLVGDAGGAEEPGEVSTGESAGCGGTIGRPAGEPLFAGWDWTASASIWAATRERTPCRSACRSSLNLCSSTSVWFRWFWSRVTWKRLVIETNTKIRSLVKTKIDRILISL